MGTYAIRRIYVAHPKSIPDAELADYVEKVTRAFTGQTLKDGSLLTPEIVSGRDSFLAYQAERRGLPANWSAWLDYILGTTQPFGGEPRFHYYVVGPTRAVGKVTADIVKKALARNRQVLHVNEEGVLQKVTALFPANEGNWKAGWYIGVAS